MVASRLAWLCLRGGILGLAGRKNQRKFDQAFPLARVFAAAAGILHAPHHRHRHRGLVAQHRTARLARCAAVRVLGADAMQPACESATYNIMIGERPAAFRAVTEIAVPGAAPNGATASA